MAAAADYVLLRLDMGETAATLPDSQAEADFAQAAALYPDVGASIHYHAARVIVARRQYAAASNQADYTQNAESENLSQVAAHKYRWLQYWEKQLDAALAAARGPVNADLAQLYPSGGVPLRPVW